MARIRSQVFRGRKMRFGRIRQDRTEPHLGAVRGDTMDIPIDGDTLDELDTIIHEAMHVCLPDVAEDAVGATATAVGRLLWRLNWRKAD